MALEKGRFLWVTGLQGDDALSIAGEAMLGFGYSHREGNY